MRGAAAANAKRTSRGRAPKRRARGALALIGTLLIASAFLRAGHDASRFFVRSAEAETPVAAGQAAEAPAEADALLEALAEREARVDKRERDVLIRMQALKVAEGEIEERLAALEAAETSLRATLDLARTASETDIRQLTEVYARMKPRQAAALFEQMDPDFAAGFLARMKPEAAAAIMAGLPPDRAYLVSVMLAGRNADVPKPEAAGPDEDAPPEG